MLLVIGNIGSVWGWSQAQSALAAREASLRALTADNATLSQSLDTLKQRIAALSAKLRLPNGQLDRENLARELDDLLSNTK